MSNGIIMHEHDFLEFLINLGCPIYIKLGDISMNLFRHPDHFQKHNNAEPDYLKNKD